MAWPVITRARVQDPLLHLFGGYAKIPKYQQKNDTCHSSPGVIMTAVSSEQVAHRRQKIELSPFLTVEGAVPYNAISV